jgi:hypothetical protein
MTVASPSPEIVIGLGVGWGDCGADADSHEIAIRSIAQHSPSVIREAGLSTGQFEALLTIGWATRALKPNTMKLLINWSGVPA